MSRLKSMEIVSKYWDGIASGLAAGRSEWLPVGRSVWTVLVDRASRLLRYNNLFRPCFWTSIIKFSRFDERNPRHGEAVTPSSGPAVLGFRQSDWSRAGQGRAVVEEDSAWTTATADPIAIASCISRDYETTSACALLTMAIVDTWTWVRPTTDLDCRGTSTPYVQD